MTTTDTDALAERIARALRQATDDGADRTEDYAAAVLPIVAEEVRKAKAEVWDEGCRDTEQFYKRTVVGVPGTDPIPAPLNPYREAGDQR